MRIPTHTPLVAIITFFGRHLMCQQATSPIFPNHRHRPIIKGNATIQRIADSAHRIFIINLPTMTPIAQQPCPDGWYWIPYCQPHGFKNIHLTVDLLTTLINVFQRIRKSDHRDHSFTYLTLNSSYGHDMFTKIFVRSSSPTKSSRSANSIDE